MKSIFKYVLVLVPLISFAQEDIKSYSAWNSLIVDYTISPKFYVENELHFRRTNFFSDWQQFIARPSIHYKVTKGVKIGGGYSYIKNYRETIDFQENNVWEEVVLSSVYGKSSVKHRFRMEHRFIETVLQDNTGGFSIGDTEFSNRFRYRLSWTIPLVTVTEDKKLKLAVFDEVWLLTEKGIVPRSLNQNWFYVGLSYPLIKGGSLGIGYMNDHGPIGNSNHRSNHILQTTFKYRIK